MLRFVIILYFVIIKEVRVSQRPLGRVLNCLQQLKRPTMVCDQREIARVDRNL